MAPHHKLMFSLTFFGDPSMEEKEINIEEVVKYLNRAFARTTYKANAKLGKTARRFKNKDGEWETTPLYDYQVEFCYIIDDIQRAPKYISTKAIQKAYYLLEEIEKEVS
jgi:hypothetical protein